MPDLRVLLLAGTVPLLAASTAHGQDATGAHLACGLEPGPTRAVADVIDGDTLRLDDSKVVKLAGVLAPRAFDVGATGGSWPPENAARAGLEALVRGQSVALAFAGPRSDRHERVIAHLFIIRDGEQTWVQQALVADGHVRVHATPSGNACLSHLIEAEAKARGSARGLWSHAAYQLRPADRPSELMRYAGTYQLVAGTVAKVTGSRSLAILELASSEPPPVEGSTRRGHGMRVVWKRGLSVMDGDTTRSLDGAQVLVRGWIESRGHPEIELQTPDQIEVQATAATPSEPPRQRRRSSTVRGNEGTARPGMDAPQGNPRGDQNESPADRPPGSKR